MASAAATSNLLKSLRDTVNCSVCQDIFKDPVTLDCGHNFCRACIAQRWEGLKRDFPCPQCRKRFRKGNIRPNPQLEEIAKQVRPNPQLEEIAKQVSAPAVKESEGETLCEEHKKPLKLYCKEHGKLICEDCDLSIEHRFHEVRPIEHAVKSSKDRFQHHIQFCTSHKEAKEALKLKEEKKIATLLTKTETERQEIVSHFERRHQILKEKEQRLLAELDEMEKIIQESKNEYVGKLSEEISHYDERIAERKEVCQKTPVEICMFYKSVGESCYKYFPEPVPVFPELEKSFSNFYQKFKVLKDAVIIKRTDVTLDPETAHPAIAVSEDGRSARNVSIQTVPDSPKRFDTLVAVLGSEGFDSGWHCWELEVGEDWAVGIATESVRRKGIFDCEPHHGIWSVWMKENKAHPSYWATAAAIPVATIPAPATPLSTIPMLVDVIPEAITLATMGDPAVMPTEILAPTSRSKTPIKIRVCLDYERGLVTFYRSDNMAPPFTYCITFTEKIFPFFWLWSAGAWVRLCP